MPKTIQGTDRVTSLVMTGTYLTRCIRSGLDMAQPKISELTPEQQQAIRRGDAEITGDTAKGLRIKGKW